MFLSITKLRLTVESTPGPVELDLGNYLVEANALKARAKLLVSMKERGAEIDENSSPLAVRGKMFFSTPGFCIPGTWPFVLSTVTEPFDDPNVRFFTSEITEYR